MLNSATDNRAVRLVQRAADALTTDEAIAFYCECLELTRFAGNALVKFSESVALDIIHGLFYFLTLAVWGLVELWELGRVKLRRETITFRTALVQAVQNARPHEFTIDFLSEASESLDIELPSFSVQALKQRVGLTQ